MSWNSWSNRNRNEELEYTETDKIKALLLGRKVEHVKDNMMVLDNGVVLKIRPNEGCGGCNSGWYDLDTLNRVDNAITDVRFEFHETDEYGGGVYEIFVYAENEQLLMKVSGDDGNGYYGSGYRIEVVLD